MSKITFLNKNCIIPSTHLLFHNYNVKPFKFVNELTIINWSDIELYKNLNNYYFPNLKQLNYISKHKHAVVDHHMIALTDFMNNSHSTTLGLYKEQKFSFSIYKPLNLFEFYFPSHRLSNIPGNKYKEIMKYSKEKQLEKVWTKSIKESISENDSYYYYLCL